MRAENIKLRKHLSLQSSPIPADIKLGEFFCWVNSWYLQFLLQQTNMKGQVKCCFPRHIIAAVAKSARILRRKRDCPGQWTLGCMISLHSQALCVWVSWTSLHRVSGVEKGQLACPNPCQGSGKSVTEPRSQFCIYTVQHIHQIPVLLVVLQALSACLCSELERCHRFDLVFASHLPGGRAPSSLLLVKTAKILPPGPSRAFEGVRIWPLFLSLVLMPIPAPNLDHFAFYNTTTLFPSTMYFSVSHTVSGSPFCCKHWETLLDMLCQSLEERN